MGKWGGRGLLALLAAAVGFFSLADTLANVVVRVDPARAHALAPWDGVITAKLAEQRFMLAPEPEADSGLARLARRALRQDATAVDALSVLGLQAQLRDDTEQARGLFTYSQALSRRELRPRIWAIEEAVSRGDIAAALQQYDIALRTARSAQDMLYPVLAAALAEPRVRAELLEIMASRPVWGESFVHFAARSGSNPQAMVRFIREGTRAGLPIDDADRTALVNALLSRELFDEAWDYYASFRPGADRRRSRDAGFARTDDAPASFDWVTMEGPGLSASIHSSEDDGLVEFFAAASTGGILLQQLQVLPPGTYRLQGRSSGVEQPDRSLPYWSLTCRDGRELGRIIVPSSAQANRTFSGRFTVPSGCPVQTLALVARPSAEITGLSGQIDWLELAPAG